VQKRKERENRKKDIVEREKEKKGRVRRKGCPSIGI